MSSPKLKLMLLPERPDGDVSPSDVVLATYSNRWTDQDMLSIIVATVWNNCHQWRTDVMIHRLPLDHFNGRPC